MTAKTRYRCRCGETKMIPERPFNDPDSDPEIRTGCQECGRITTHKPVGTPRGWS